MELVIDQPHLVDTLRFRLQAARTLPQEDIRITAAVNVLVPASENDPVDLERRIRETLARVIKADWVFTRIERDADAAGYERIQLRASARVPKSENWNLAERFRAASRDGVAVSPGEVSYALSSEKVDAAVEALRLDLLQLASSQAAKMSAASGRQWRIGDIEFGAAGLLRQGGRRTGKGAYTDEEDSIEMLALQEGAGVTGGERITLVAQVVLKASVASPRPANASGAS